MQCVYLHTLLLVYMYTRRVVRVTLVNNDLFCSDLVLCNYQNLSKSPDFHAKE